jgi:hypothetical protein
MAVSALPPRSLFSARERADDRPRAHGEPSYAFLDRAAGPRWERVRTALDGWFLRLPEAARRDLRNRFALTTELDHLGAFWELWLHEAHRRLGFDLTVHVGVDAGERRQDFLVSRPDGFGCFWLEATVVGGDSPLTFTERKLHEALCDLIELVSAPPEVSLGLSVLRYGTCTPGRRRVVPRVERWLRELGDPDALRARQAAGLSAPTRRVEFDGWQFELEAIAGRRRPGSERRVLATRPIACPPQRAVNDIRPLRRKIKKKAARYGRPDRPYLLAVLALGDHVRDRDVESALLGIPGRESDHAVWHGPAGPCNTRLSGVLVARGLQPARGSASPPRLWRNPWAVHPLGAGLPWGEAGSSAPLSADTPTVERLDPLGDVSSRRVHTARAWSVTSSTSGGTA